jgi:hypothetical protein
MSLQTTVTAPEYLNPFDMLGYLRRLFEPGDWVNLQLIHQTETWTDEHGVKHARVDNNYATVESLLKPETLQRIAEAQDKGWNSYVAMNAFTPGVERRRKKDVKSVRNVYIEFDENGETGLEAIDKDIAERIIPAPDFVLQSSPGKFYVIWCVKDFTVEKEEALNSALQQRYGSDPASVDVARVLRLPGTRNLKPKYNPTPVVEIVEESIASRHTPQEFKIDAPVVEQKKATAISSEKLSGIIDLLLDNLDEARVEHGPAEDYDGGYKIDLDECLWGKGHQNGNPGDASVFVDESGRLGYHCFHTHCAEHYRWKEFRAELERRVGHKMQFAEETPVIIGGKVIGQPTKVSIPFESEDKTAWSCYGLTEEEYAIEMDKDYPVLKFAEEQPGPTWDDDVMYGIAGTIIRKASEHCEAHPAGMYLDLLIAMGSIFGHQPRCRIHPAAHYTNEFGLRVGLTSTGRKGTGDNAINEVIKHVDSHWYQHRRISRFGSAEAIINEVRDPFVQQIRAGGRKDGPQFKEITVPGVDDKRLFIRVGEFSAVLDLVNKRDSGAASVMRLGWDGDPLDDVVKGKSNDGISNSVRCAEPHISIFADTTKSELISKMPAGADENGFGNRFLYCYAYRTKLCPNGGPELDWGQEIARLIEAVEFAKDIKHVPMTKVAHKVWSHMYEEMERTRPGGMLGLMVTRGPAHVRRLAMILALLDLNDAVETKHLHAAKKFWDYCEESARYIFTGYTKEQLQILKWVESKQSVTVTEIARDLFHWNRKATWVRTQVNDLARQGYLAVAGEQVKSKKERAA